MVPKKRTMLLVACAVSARTVLVACGDNHQYLGFYNTDAMAEDVTQQGPDVLFGYYPYDGPYEVGLTDAADADAHMNASDAPNDGPPASDSADE